MRIFYLFVAVGLAALSGCATVTSSDTQSISVSTYTADGDPLQKAHCTLHNDKGSWQIETPGFTQVHKSNDDLLVECAKDGQPKGYARAISRVTAGMFGNILIGGVVGAVIDHQTGSGYDYPPSILVRMGGSVVFDKSNEGTSVAAAPAPAASSPPGPEPSVPEKSPASAVALAAPVDPSLPANFPRPGDRWSYQYIDGYTGRRGAMFVHEVLNAKKGEVDERMFLADKSAFSDEQAFTFDSLQVLERAVPGANRTEFAPYLQAFRPNMDFGDVGPVSNGLQGNGTRWQYRGRVVGHEIVLVPAGSFDAIKVDISGRTTRRVGFREADKVEHVIWYAPKVKRYVKYEINSWSGYGPMEKQRFELVDFKVQ